MKTTLRILILVLVSLVALFSLAFISDEKGVWLNGGIHQLSEVAFNKSSLSNFPSGQKTELSYQGNEDDEDQAVISETFSETLDVISSGLENLTDWQSELNSAQLASCIQTPTTAPTAKIQTQVYQWVDDRGVTHFGDRPPQSVQSSHLENLDIGGVDYFDMEIEYIDTPPVPFLSDQLTVSMEEVYDILADLIGEEYLRQVELKLKIFPDINSFKAYGGSALSQQAVGFYRAATNESVTFRHTDHQNTLRVARHESVHVILAGLLGGGSVPTWLNEGLAEYFELLEMQGQFSQIPPNVISMRVAQALTESGYPSTLENYVSLSPEQWYADGQAHYSLAGTLIYFLMDSRQGRDTLSVLLGVMAANYCQPVDQVAIISEQYPDGLKGLFNDYQEWLFARSLSTKQRF